MADVSNDTVVATNTASTRSLANRFADIINVLDEGAAGDGTTDDRTAFADADTDASNSTILVPPGTYRFASSITISSTLLLLPGAVLKPDSGVTVTLSEVPSAEDQKVFDLSASATADVDIADDAHGTVYASWWGPAANGTTDDSQALQAAFDAAENKVLIFSSPDTFGFASSLTIQANTRIENNGAVLHARYTTTGATPAVFVNSDVEANALHVVVDTTFNIRRGVKLSSDTAIRNLSVTSVDQQDTSTANIDAALIFGGDRLSLGKVTIKNWDRGTTIDAHTDLFIEEFHIENFQRGFYANDSDNIEVLSGEMQSTTAIGDQAPGHDGFLISGCNDFKLTNYTIKECGEHGIYVSGSRDSERLVFGNIQVWKPGQCGLKTNMSTGYTVRYLQINGLTVVDAASEGATGTNEDGLRLMDCTEVTVNGFQVTKTDAHDYSANVGIYIENGTQITINGPRIYATKSHGIQMADDSGKVNKIYINNPSLILSAPNSDTHGIFVDSPTEVLRDIVVSNCYIRNQTGYGVKVQANSGSVGVNEPCIFSGWVENDGDGVFDSTTTDGDVYNYLTTL